MNFPGGGIFGTPEDALEKITHLQELSGGFGTLLCFVHDWTPPDLARKSYDLLARHVMPPHPGLAAAAGSLGRAGVSEQEGTDGQGGRSDFESHSRIQCTEHPREE